RSNAELPSLIAAHRFRAMAFGWMMAAVALGVVCLMSVGLAVLLASASHAAAIVLLALSLTAGALCAVLSRRASRRAQDARAKLDEAWQRVAHELLQAQSGLTAAELGRRMHTDEAHAAQLLAGLSAAGRVRVAVRDDAELSYSGHDEPLPAPIDAAERER